MSNRVTTGLLLALTFLAVASCDRSPTRGEDPDPPPDPMEVFRFETFGNETWWTDTLAMNQVIQAAVDPATALAVGLKVDADALPPGLLESADLTDPATTVELIRLDAVLGIHGEVDQDGNLTQVGVTCALCHSTVDNSVMDGIGHRLDGWPNLDLNPGLIVSLSPHFQDPAAQDVLTSWGPGMFDPRFNIDGINDPVVIPDASARPDFRPCAIDVPARASVAGPGLAVAAKAAARMSGRWISSNMLFHSHGFSRHWRRKPYIVPL